jgi:hypothetical protein
MNSDISDLVLDELHFVRKKCLQLVELLRYFVGQENGPVYASLREAVAALEAAEAEVSRLRRPALAVVPPAGQATYRVSPEERTVYLTVNEGAPFDAFRNALESALADPAYRPGFNFLSDCSRMTTLPDPSQMRRGADFFRQPAAITGGCRWAMVASTPALQGMQGAFGGVIETVWGAQTKVFDDTEEARRWLLEEAA